MVLRDHNRAQRVLRVRHLLQAFRRRSRFIIWSDEKMFHVQCHRKSTFYADDGMKKRDIPEERLAHEFDSFSPGVRISYPFLSTESCII